MAQKVKSRPTKKSAPPANGAKEMTEMPAITIDYPRENEKVMVGHYAVRVSAPSGAQVELIVNNGEERPCRESIGFYWYDW